LDRIGANLKASFLPQRYSKHLLDSWHPLLSMLSGRFWRWLALGALLFCTAACQPQPVDDLPISTPQITSTIEVFSPLPAIPQLDHPEFPLAGVEVYSLASQAGSEQNNLSQVVQSSAYWVRRNLVLWSAVEPEQGQRDWKSLEALEAELLNAAEKHLQVILVVRGTPAWAQLVPGSVCGPVLPEKLPAFASFLHDLVARYSQPPYQVKYWELGNEPDVDPTLVASDSIFGCWGKTGDSYYGGQDYAEMLKVAYPQIKAADAQAQVLVGGLLLDCDPHNPPAGRSCDPAYYLEGILKNNGGDYFDGVSFHAYDYYLGPYQFGNPNWGSNSDTSGPSLVVKAEFLRNLLAEYNQSEKYLLNTELGLLCGSTGDEPQCQEQVFQLSKAAYIAISNAAAVAEGLRANVWYSLLGWRGSGLVTADRQPLPAFDAFRFSAQMLNGATFVRQIDDYPGVRGYEFVFEGRRIWLLWSSDRGEHRVQLPETPAELYDVLGTAQTVDQVLLITPAPVYVVFPLQ
jgi:hypothetical protein